MPLIFIRLAVGMCLLLLGRKLFWGFVAAIGFFAGLHFAGHFLAHHSDTTLLLVALGCGVAGALLAIFLQKIAVILAGFVGGAAILEHVFRYWGSAQPQHVWIAALVGGLAGAILMALTFDWALIVLSSLLGAAFVSELLPVGPELHVITYAALFIVGMVAQSRIKGSSYRK